MTIDRIQAISQTLITRKKSRQQVLDRLQEFLAVFYEQIEQLLEQMTQQAFGRPSNVRRDKAGVSLSPFVFELDERWFAFVSTDLAALPSGKVRLSPIGEPVARTILFALDDQTPIIGLPLSEIVVSADGSWYISGLGGVKQYSVIDIQEVRECALQLL